MALVSPAPARACASDADCGEAGHCRGVDTCGAGTCVPAFAIERFPVDAGDDHAYTAPVIAVLDHAGAFYTQCCDTRIVAFTGEEAVRGGVVELCPSEPVLPMCFFTPFCICGYGHPAGGSYVVNGVYVGAVLGPGVLSYDGHAGYDYRYGFGTPLVATADGQLCKAREDLVNGRGGEASAWDRFHTFYVDHGEHGGVGWSSWYLHATDLAGTDVFGADLALLEPGECAPVHEGDLVATVGNVGTFAPHLHFEVRAYEPEHGPEASTARIVDPYGWSGDGPDPWSDPTANRQARAQQAPLWIACGNGRIECGESCDDGDAIGGDGCSSTCVSECGDANGDGRVDASDARSIQRCVTGQSPCPASCDANGDGACTTADARAVLRVAVGQLLRADLRCGPGPSD